MRVVWSRRAIRQLGALREHIEKDSEENAALIARRILERSICFKRILQLDGPAESWEHAN
jgi:hypothetical protein